MERKRQVFPLQRRTKTSLRMSLRALCAEHNCAVLEDCEIIVINNFEETSGTGACIVISQHGGFGEVANDGIS